MEEYSMKREKTITIKVTTKEYERISRSAADEEASLSDYIRSRIAKDISKKWIKKTIVQQILSRIANTLDKYEEKNTHLTNAIRKDLSALWEKL